MEPERKPPAPEKVLSVEDWESPEHAVRSIRRAMIASWVTWPSIFIGYWISRKSASEDMRDLVFLLTMLSLPLLRWLLRRNVPHVNTAAMQIEWAVFCLFVFAMGLLAAGVVNNDIMSAVAAYGLGVVLLYVIGAGILDEIRLFRDPLRFLPSNKGAAGTRSPK
ncbi:MAG: hypothetical protein ACO1QR_12730 [Chthoniobacteraceae bacterium]